MTEEEAKTKWCPFARALIREQGSLSENGSVANRASMTGNGLLGTNCIGSACMAWRWEDIPNTYQADANSFRTTGTVKSDRYGYCGLAGKP